jgi:class 3 adenylate cyclase
MSTLSDLQKEVKAIFATNWDTKDGTTVPDVERVALASNKAVTLDATVLYADLAQSTTLVNSHKAEFAAEVYKAFLVVACRVIRANGGELTAFDGDRVMAVFLGNVKNSSAATAALQINWAVSNVINPALKAQYSNSSYVLSHSVGIDTSSLLVAKTGIRGANDLVWVGRAANYAAKLSALREDTHSSFITEDVYKRLRDDVKTGGSPKTSMWEKRVWRETGQTIYRSNWWWSL